MPLDRHLLHRRTLLWVAGTFLVTWLGVCYGAAWMLTRRFPVREPGQAPRLQGISAQSLELRTQDGERIQAWWYPLPNSQRVAISLHGNGGSQRHNTDAADLFLAAGYSVLLPTLRAHGTSSGGVNDFGRSAAHDVHACLQEVTKRLPSARVLLHGRSLGAAAALFHPPDPRIVGYLLESPYDDLAHALRRRLEHRLPGGLSHLTYWGMWWTSRLVLEDPDSISPRTAASRGPRAPALFLAGELDRRCPPEDVARVANAFAGEARVTVLPKAQHGSLAKPDPERYRREIQSFLAQLEP